VYVVAIIAAAGRGRRFGSAAPKPLARLGDRTLLQRSIDAFARSERVSEIIVATPADAPAGFAASLSAGVPLRTVRGGARRQDSVANAFDAVPAHADVVVVHDAARALVTPELIARTIDAAAASGAAIAATASRDTVKRVAPGDRGRLTISATLPRDEIYLAQTPQAFRRAVLADAVALGRRGLEATDEAMLAERAGHPVEIVESDETNIKVTTARDLTMAEAIVKAEGRQPRADSAFRVGVGYDLHRLVEGRRLVLGGVTIPFDRGPHGHSDGDAICHAMTDAVLGAVSAGDIGRHFPDDDPRWKGADSTVMLRAAVEIARARGYAVENADLVVILERPKLAPHVDAIRAMVAQCLGVGVESVSVKGKTNEGTGAIGRGEAIAVHAVVAMRSERSPDGGHDR
jgi:2-C-methyl-D-erythritol 4-phosphate cytidylyltransferase/2-C-methyl-D-erythritol 2,4-cyclodiphosphate synthase